MKIRDQNPDVKECPNENCETDQGIRNMFYNVNEGQSYLYCEVCKIEWCLSCDMVYHVEKTCDEVQEEKR